MNPNEEQYPVRRKPNPDRYEPADENDADQGEAGGDE